VYTNDTASAVEGARATCGIGAIEVILSLAYMSALSIEYNEIGVVWIDVGITITCIIRSDSSIQMDQMGSIIKII
jgi:hypothetical protein